MKNHHAAALIFSITANTLAAQPFSLQWDARFGGSLPDQFVRIVETSGNGFLLGGISSSPADGDKSATSYGGFSDFWLVKTDAGGVKQWDRTYGGDYFDDLTVLITTSDGGFLAGGPTESSQSYDVSEPGRGLQDYWVVKLDSNGVKLWDKRFGGNSTDYLYTAIELGGGGYVLGGYSFSDAGGDKSQPQVGGGDYWIVKITGSGSVVWDKTFGGADGDFLLSLDEIPGGMIAGGRSLSDSTGDMTRHNHGGSDFWILKLDAAGNKIWDITLGGTFEERLYSIRQTSDGGFIAGGNTDSPISGDVTHESHSQDFWVVKLDSAGNIMWDETYGGALVEEISLVDETSGGGYLISGDSYSNAGYDKSENNLGAEQVWVIKTDNHGQKLWDKTFFTTGHDENGIVLPIRDGCFIAAAYSEADTGGYKSQWSRGGADYWMVKFCMGAVGIGLQPNVFHFDISPNPVSNATGDDLNVHFESYGRYVVAIYNSHGTMLVRSEENADTMRFDVKEFLPGIYFVRITNEYGKSVVKKIVKM